MNTSAQIVHEAETQRQHVRLNLPAQVEIDGKLFTVKDLSSGGMALRECNDHVKKGQIIHCKLFLPFNDFTLDLGLEAEVLYIDKKSNSAGCRFINLTPSKISILNHVLKSFMTGDLVNSGDLINVVSRENFVNIRKNKEDVELSQIEKIKRYGVYGLIIITGLFLAFFIIQNIMNKIFVVQSSAGVVQGSKIEILAPMSGVLSLSLPEGSMTVRKGQMIGEITGQENTALVTDALETITVNRPTQIISPCDCTIIQSNILGSEYVPQDKKLYTLIPQKEELTIVVTVSVQDVHRLNIGTHATVDILGEKQKLKGKIINIVMNDSAFSFDQVPTAKVILKTDVRLAIDLMNRPVSVEFHL